MQTLYGKSKALINAVKMLRLSFTETPFIELQDRKATIKVTQRIPPVCYQTWETKLFGKNHFKSLNIFRDINPDISFEIFDLRRRDDYMNTVWADHEILEIYNKALFGPMKADIFRYCVIYDLGGYYFDISKACSVPLRTLHNEDDNALISYESNICLLLPDSNLNCKMLHPEHYVLQWGFGFEKKHKILEKQIESIIINAHLFEGRIFTNPKDAILAFTGPGMFTRNVRDYLSSGSLLGVVQAGIDFNGNGIFSLPGSEARYLQVPAYATANNSKILSGPN